MAFSGFLSKEAQVRLPNPDEISNLGYAQHVADDESAGPVSRAMAKKVVDDFKEIKTDSEVEEAYMRTARAIVLWLGRGITRKKIEWETELLLAEKDANDKRMRMYQDRFSKSWLRLVWLLAGPLVGALVGFIVAQILGTIVSEDISSSVGSRAPTALATAIVGFIGLAISLRILRGQEDAIKLEYRDRCNQAHIKYELDKLTEYQAARTQICDAWREYVGGEFRATASYALVMMSEAETRKRVEQQQRGVYTKTNIVLLRKVVRILRRAARLPQSVKRPAALPPAPKARVQEKDESVPSSYPGG